MIFFFFFFLYVSMILKNSWIEGRGVVCTQINPLIQHTFGHCRFWCGTPGRRRPSWKTRTRWGRSLAKDLIPTWRCRLEEALSSVPAISCMALPQTAYAHPQGPGKVPCLWPHAPALRQKWYSDLMGHTLNVAFRHLPPNSARFSGVLFISMQLSTNAVTVSTLWKVRVLTWL